MMGTFSNEFFNVTSPGEGQGFSAIMEGTREDVRGKLHDILIAASEFSSGGGTGGIVYLPPRDYRIFHDPTRDAAAAVPGSDDPDPPLRPVVGDPGANSFMHGINLPELTIPPNVLLWFAPGARLVLNAEVIIQILGSIRAEATPIFFTNPVDPGQRRGRVVFMTTKMHEVYPEWWGAIGSPDDLETMGHVTDDTEALEDCFRAALNDRAFTNVTYPPLAVILRGNYSVTHEIQVKAEGLRFPPHDPNTNAPIEEMTAARDARTAENRRILRNGSGVLSPGGLKILGQRGTAGGADGGPVGFTAIALTMPGNDFLDFTEAESSGRSLLRIEGVAGCIIEGVNFNGADRASVCVQITGSNTFNCVFRNCSFVNARHVLMQVGDYVITAQPDGVDHTIDAFPTDSHPVPASITTVNSGYDLSGLIFDNCLFQSSVMDIRAPPETAPVGLVFHATNTLPMTLDHCLFKNAMLACIEAYGGAMIVRGGNAQNSLIERQSYEQVALIHGFSSQFGGSSAWRERPRGGVDIFIGDVPRRRYVDVRGVPGATTDPPTSLTVLEFASQSNRFLETFRHRSAAAGLGGLSNTILQSVFHDCTSPIVAPAAVFWSGPARPGAGSTMRSAGTLTLIGCVFGGRRRPFESMTAAPDSRVSEPVGAVVVDKFALMVGDVGTRVVSGATPVFYQFDATIARNSDSSNRRYTPVEGDLRNFPWYRKM